MSIFGFSNLSGLPALMSTLLWVVRLGCLAAVLYVLVDAVWYFVAGPKDQSVSSRYAVVSEFQHTPIDTSKITSTELFGKTEEIDQREPLEALQTTTLNLTLEGTFVADDDATHSVALISSRSSRDEVREYREGDAVASFAELETIHPRFVVISRGGERERLAFDSEDILSESAKPEVKQQSPREARPATTSQRPRSPRTSLSNFDQRSNVRGDAEMPLPSDFSFDELMSLGLAEIQTANGAALKISNSSESSPLSRLGMQPGDLVMSVNGHPVEAFRQDEQLAQKVANSGVARLEIQRGGRQFFLSVPIP